MKYLRIKLVGHEVIRAYTNDKKQTRAQPDYKGDGVAVWINERPDEETQGELHGSA